MLLTYDPKRNVAYLRLRETDSAELETVRISDEVNVDLAPDSAVYGIELLNVNEQLSGRSLVRDWGPKRLEVPLSETV